MHYAQGMFKSGMIRTWINEFCQCKLLDVPKSLE